MSKHEQKIKFVTDLGSAQEIKLVKPLNLFHPQDDMLTPTEGKKENWETEVYISRNSITQTFPDTWLATESL